MNSVKQTSHDFCFNDCLTLMKSFKGLPITRGSRNRSLKRRRTHEFPFYWLVLLCVLLIINCVIAEARDGASQVLSKSAVNNDQTSSANTSTTASKAQGQKVSLIIIDRNLEQVERLLSGVRGEVHLLILEEETEPFEQINQALESEPPYSNVTIVAKASSSAIYLGGRWIDKNYLVAHQSSVNFFGEQFSQNSELTLYTTNLITTHSGQEFIGVLAHLTQLNVDIVHIQGAQEDPLWVKRTRFSF